MVKRITVLSGSLCLLAMAACVTVNIYFPAAEMQKAADAIVEEIRGAPVQQDAQAVSSLIMDFCGTAYAQDINIDISSAKIRALRGSMKGRAPLLEPFFNGANLGENKDGYVSILSEDGLGLKEKSQLRSLSEQENSDREELYKEITLSNGLGAENVTKTAAVFARSWRGNARSGWMIQKDKGSWVKK